MCNFYPKADLPWQEIEKIRHEVNTLYSKYKDKALIIHKSIGLDDCYYNYYIENYGYDDIRIVARISNND